ncbi:hypothetical protein GURASL_13450 [Geotalea uraniireducens]|uniref:Glycoside hydrolase family 19 protein n=1 Tax=Geotalea uraniireducens TaxID=351604 RepID=A0ABN6VSN3_9BACT|nr:hypothetical protein [Geotalea uraniireducens]BDV42422.1 hypothetical protein GURASL_13450 [Geotalea uraniireducens]
MLITNKQFRQLFPANKNPEDWADAINTICPQYGINNARRLAAFLAQVGHESQEFTRMTENLNYSAQGLADTWPNRYAVDPKARPRTPNALARRLEHDPGAIGNNVYANRLGNGPEESGDGYRYRGHGPLQVTGRDNLMAFAQAVGKSLEDALQYIRTPTGGIISACLHWQHRNLNHAADQGDVVACTKLVNGGTIGLAERRALNAKAAALLGVASA